MWKDIVYSFRTLRRSPVFAAVAVLSLALGIGANTAIFSLLDQVVLRSLPVRDPETLTVLHREYAPNGTSSSDNSESVFSYPMYRDLRDRDKAFETMVARMGASGVQLIDRGNNGLAKVEIVSGNFFSTMGIGAATGRVLAPEDDGAPGAHPVAVLSHNYWVNHFANSPAVLNQTVILNGHPFVVVGVAEARFHGLMQGQTPDLFVPIAMQREIMPAFDALENRTIRWLNLFARRKSGEDLRQAQAATDVVYRSILQFELSGTSLASERERERFLNHRVELRPAAHGLGVLRDKWEKPLRVLMVMVGLVLLIACANVAGLLMARATGRQREIAIRLAIGAGRGALVRQLLFEGLMLALAGGAAGLLVEHWSTKALLGLLPRDAVGTWLTTGLNLELLGFTLALSVTCGLVFALLPALQATRPDLTSTLKDRAGSVTSGGHPARLRQALVTMQVALSMLLVVGAGLFSVSARGLLGANLGFRTQHMLMFSVNRTYSQPSAPAAVIFYRDLQDRLAALPQVTAVSLAIGGPLSGSNRGGNLTIEGYQPQEDEYVGSSIVAVSPAYFQGMGIPLRAGREFTVRDDAAAPKAVVVNDAFVKRYFAGRNAVGKRLMFGASNRRVPDREIVGVVADSRSDPRDPGKATIYYPYVQWEKAERMVYYLRIAGDENRLVPEVRNAVRAADPNLPAANIRSVDVYIRESQYTGLLIAILSSAFGILATLLAAIGLYGLVTYAVARRTGEIGVRMALGALPGDVLRMILREAGTMAAVGIVIGLGAAVALSRLVSSQLFGVKAADPGILAGAAILLGFIALMAAMVPAWRASRIDPLSALKYE